MGVNYLIEFEVRFFHLIEFEMRKILTSSKMKETKSETCGVVV